MPSFSRLISFESQDGNARYFTDLGANTIDVPKIGATIDAYASFDDLVDDRAKVTATVGKVISVSLSLTIECLYSGLH